MENNIEITENAQEHIANVLKKDNVKYFRITVLGGGCAGFQYKFDFENKVNSDDILIPGLKIEILVDNYAFSSYVKIHPDYVNELIGSSFKIINPQASSSCGCGTSFSL